MTLGRLPLVATISAVAMLALLAVFAAGGRLPEFRGLVKFEPDGIVAVPAAAVTRVEIRGNGAAIAFDRGADGWALAGAPVPAELAGHVDAGLRFLNVTGPTRQLDQEALADGAFAEYGLDPPDSLIVLATAEGPVATVSFGSLNAPGTAQYARPAGAATVYLMPRHLGGEWDVVQDMAARLPGGTGTGPTGTGAGLLLPVSMAQVWAVEVVRAGTITRFERDSAGDWFRHTGQHSHATGAGTHKADPAQARLIGAALATFGETTIERHVAPGADERDLAEFGLAFPEIIVLLYARDNSTPVARLELGQLSGGFERFVHLAPEGEVVTIAEFEVRHVTDLLKTGDSGS